MKHLFNRYWRRWWCWPKCSTKKLYCYVQLFLHWRSTKFSPTDDVPPLGRFWFCKLVWNHTSVVHKRYCSLSVLLCDSVFVEVRGQNIMSLASRKIRLWIVFEPYICIGKKRKLKLRTNGHSGQFQWGNWSLVLTTIKAYQQHKCNNICLRSDLATYFFTKIFAKVWEMNGPSISDC